MADFDPSDFDSDEDEGIEEEENPMEDVMGDDDIELLKKGRVRNEHRKQTFGR